MTQQIVVCYTVANEATTIVESIRSLKAYVDRFVVIDSIFDSNPIESTHSTDDTEALTRLACAAHPARPLTYVSSNAKLVQTYARNAYLELVDPPDWVFVVDGDEVFYGDHIKILELFAAIRTPSHPQHDGLGSSIALPVFTTAVNVHKMAPDVTPDEFAYAPLISTVGYMPRLFQAHRSLRYTVPSGASTPALTYLADSSDDPPRPLDQYLLPTYAVPPGDMFIINHHPRQSLEAYKNDYVWATRGVLP
jgi:glycosyltransferase involved in cell wall biosynthesis